MEATASISMDLQQAMFKSAAILHHGDLMASMTKIKLERTCTIATNLDSASSNAGPR